MFLWNSRTSRTKAQQFLCRLVDQWTMDRVRRPEDQRSETRTTLNVGVWLIPINEAVPEISQTFLALTKDVNSKGLSVITNRSISMPEFLVGFSAEPEAIFLRAKVANRKQLGMGWLQLGMEVTGIVEVAEHPQLRRFTGTVMF